MCQPALQERYVNFYTDFAFKKLFGTEINKDLLMSFLNSLFDGREVIKDLHYLNVEHVGHIAAERKAVFDVYCENEKGEKFLIEMQKAEQDYFKDRSIFYSTFPIQEQAPQGKWNFQLNRVYTIGILNFTFDDEKETSMNHEVKLLDINTKEVFYDKLTYIYLEMPKFTKKEDELVTIFDKWLYAIKNMATLLDRPAALQEAIFTRLFEQAEIAKLNTSDLRSYRESQKDFWDMCAVTETAERKGRAEGRAEEKMKNAKALKDSGLLTNAQIADTLNISIDDVDSL
ncbi:MAG: PD-(D/E)XK nuclease family transposase [Bacteroidales bacterium]|nr:PD-(D/E)XK nuclease family transposase [Bacteroidales bacterium]